MKQEALSQYADIHLILFAMFIFLSVFVIITIRVFRRSEKNKFKEIAEIPLHVEVNYERQ